MEAKRLIYFGPPISNLRFWTVDLIRYSDVIYQFQPPAGTHEGD